MNISSGSSFRQTASSAPRQPQVAQSIDELDRETSALMETTEKVLSRFESVLGPNACLEKDQGKRGAPASAVPLAGRLAELTFRVSVANSRLCELLARAEL